MDWTTRMHRSFRYWYAKYYYDILENIFMFVVGMLIICVVLAVAEGIGR